MDGRNFMASPLLGLIGFIIAMIGFMFTYIIYMGWFGHFSLYGPLILSLLGAILLFIHIKYRESEEGLSSDSEYNWLRALERWLPISSPVVAVLTGLAVITLDLAYQRYSEAPGVGDADMMVLLFGGGLIVYPFVPKKYTFERDFIFTFFLFLAILMSFIPFLFSMEKSGFKYYFLLLPLHKVLLSLGIENIIIPPATLKITDPMSKIKSDIVIARACSGIYSFSIFIASSISFILVIYREINWKSVLFIAFAIVLAYVGNVIRMTIVTLSGYYYGQDTLSWVHETIGYPIFFAWMAFFWFILYRFLIKEDEEKDRETDSDIS